MVSPLRPERASRGVFALVVTGLLGVGMVLILVINTSLAQGAFTVSELQAQQSTLTQQEQTLAEAVAAAAAPETLEQQARALGMVPSENPVFLDVTSGTVLGKPKAAGGATAPSRACSPPPMPPRPRPSTTPRSAPTCRSPPAPTTTRPLPTPQPPRPPPPTPPRWPPRKRLRRRPEAAKKARQEGEEPRCREQPLAGLDRHRRDRVLGGCRPRRGAGGVMAYPGAAA